jgi:hypothetical protein
VGFVFTLDTKPVEVAAAIVSLGSFFVTDGEGNAATPALPYTVFA